MFRIFALGVYTMLSFLLLSGCERLNNLQLTDFRFVILAVILFAVAISVAASYKNGGK